MTGANHPLDLGKKMEFYIAMMGDNTTLKSIYPSSYLGIPFVGKVMTISKAQMWPMNHAKLWNPKYHT